jgi:hypothetical protein
MTCLLCRPPDVSKRKATSSFPRLPCLEALQELLEESRGGTLTLRYGIPIIENASQMVSRAT